MAFNNAVNAKQQGTQYLSTAGAWTGVDGGSAGNVYTSNGTGVAPSFQAASAGTYYSLTPYIVGSDIHSQYSTIGAAITAAVGAGASAATPANIYIKPGTYVENPALADGINLIGFVSNSNTTWDKTNGGANLNPSPNVRITGAITYAPSAAADTSASIQNLYIQPTAGNTSGVTYNSNTGGAGADHFIVTNCVCLSTGTGRGFNYLNTSGNVNVYLNNCYLSSLTDNSNGILRIQECFIAGTTVITTSLGSSYNLTRLSGTLTNNNTNGGNIFDGCEFGTTISGAAGSSMIFYDCQLGGTITSSGSVSYATLRGTAPIIITSAGGGNVGHTEWGDTIISQVRGGGNASISAVTNYFGHTGTTAATLSLPNTSVGTGQVFIIKDEGGSATTGNITINVTGGTKTIDGAASIAIVLNYGAVRVIYDGTNYFTW